MNAKIRKIYNDLVTAGSKVQLQTASADADLLSAADFLIRRVIEERGETVLKKRKLKLREDAKLLIIVLCKYMILTPILGAKARTISQTIDAVQSDLERILTAAKGDSSREISGHAILVAVAEQWGDLDVGDFGIWN